MSKKQQIRMITVEEAINLLPDGEDLHTFRNPGPSILLGGDISRKRLIEILNANADTIQIGGDSSRALKHGLVIIDNVGPLFISTDEEKLNAFDPIK